MIADMIHNKNRIPVVIELFIKGTKWNISIVFITLSYFKVPKDITINATCFFLMKILNKKERPEVAWTHSSDIDFKDFIKFYRKCTAEPYYFLPNDTTLLSANPLRFRNIF